MEWSRAAKSAVARKKGFKRATPEELARIAALLGGAIVYPPEDLRKPPHDAEASSGNPARVGDKGTR
ncbi:MAG: hypothetical protein PHU25_00780 [Deltaproteobacteria bacterium]|nr:hypothetical protein [Deltaproteobacteria bacterium]